MACMASLKHAPNGSDLNFVPIFRNIEVSRSMRSLEWIRLYQIHVLCRDVMGAGDIRHIPPDFLKGQCTYAIGVLDSRKKNC